MNNEASAPTMRPARVEYDNRGNPVWKSRMSTPDNTQGVCFMVPDRIIPMIFVPGVMGSHLRGISEAKGSKWLLDSSTSMIKWLSLGAKDRKRLLRPETMEVSTEGKIPTGTHQSKEELERRGWGEGRRDELCRVSGANSSQSGCR
jgi:hypothetical protein